MDSAILTTLIQQDRTSGCFNDTLFRSGGITDPNPRLLALIEDNGGINTAGTGIGHELHAGLIMTGTVHLSSIIIMKMISTAYNKRKSNLQFF